MHRYTKHPGAVSDHTTTRVQQPPPSIVSVSSRVHHPPVEKSAPVFTSVKRLYKFERPSEYVCDDARVNRRPLGVLCTGALCKRGGGGVNNRLWALDVLCTGTLCKRGGGGGMNRRPLPLRREESRIADAGLWCAKTSSALSSLKLV